MTLTLPITLLDNHDPDLALPAHETPGSAGMDLRACLAPKDRARGWVVPTMGRVLVPTGLAIAIPSGHEGQIRPRSGLAARAGITVLNSPGTIDSDYRGELRVLLINFGPQNFTLSHGERIAQLVIAPYATSVVKVVIDLDSTERGDGGFGSTGVQ